MMWGSSTPTLLLAALAMDRLIPIASSPLLSRLRRETGPEETTSLGPPPAYEEGPHKLISDSLYSLIIFIYVSITFLYMFYAFCWRSAVNKPMPDSKDLPMITDMLDQVEAQSNGHEKKEAV